MIPRKDLARIRRCSALATTLAVFCLMADIGLAQAAQEPKAEQEPTPDKTTPRYDSQGKRDPFLSLRTLKRPVPVEPAGPPPLNQRPPGLSGLLVDELTVVGTVAGADSTVALLRGVDNFTYFARSGTRVFDGFVETIGHIDSIGGDGVSFVREVVDTRGVRRRFRVVKRLYAEDVRVEELKNGKP